VSKDSPNRNIIAIDGPSGVGKGTLTGRLCAEYGFAGLDTGSLYRAITLSVLERVGDVGDAAMNVAIIEEISADHSILEYAKRPEIRGIEVSNNVAAVSANQTLRDKIVRYQRDFGYFPPGGAKGAVVEGRDIGSVIFPDAPVKLYLDASPEAKAERRFLQYKGQGIDADYDAILADLVARDRKDREFRLAHVGALWVADAVVIDPTDMGKDAVFDLARKVVREKLGI
jgi:cytidylate kinase